jgi:hypothetical protein
MLHPQFLGRCGPGRTASFRGPKLLAALDRSLQSFFKICHSQTFEPL